MTQHLLELGLIAAATVLVAAPLLSRIERPRARVAATIAALLLLALGLRSLPDRRGLRPAVAASPDRPVVAMRGGYVGADACLACHPGEHASWRDTYHRTMTQRPSPLAVRGDFAGVSLVGPDGATWALSRDGERFLAARAGAPASDVVLVTGSHHMQVYWLPGAGQGVLAQLPFVWLIDDQRWVPRNAAFLRPPEVGRAPPSETGRWNLVCLRCHTTDPQSQPLGRLDAFETRVGELGISCEVCHGPGADHAAANRDPARRYALHLRLGGERADETIVNPRRLDALRSSQVCGQCHSINSEKSEADWREWVTRGFAFRPGQDLLATRAVMQPPLDPADELSRTILSMDPHFVEDRFWNDGQVRVTGRELNGLLRSPCFAKGELSCVTCHALHRAPDDARPAREWANDQLHPAATGDATCASCHEPQAKEGQAHTRHAGVSCMDCHMPHTSYGLLKAIRSHEVSSPDVGTSLATGRPNACNLCHLDRPLAWTAEKLEAWFGTPAPAIPVETRDVAAGPLWLLTGDAGQRALVTWATGWTPARQAAGTWWQAPYLAHLLRQDPYDAVRLLAWRSLRSLPAAEGVPLDPIAPAAERARAADAVLERWAAAPRSGPTPTAAGVLAPDGALDRERFEALGARRDDKRVDLIE